MLLLYRQGGRVVNDVWGGFAGGHFEEHELNDTRACVLRELWEKLGITEKDMKNNVSESFTSSEGVSRWFPLSELISLEMPFTSKYVIGHYLNVVCKTDVIYGGIADGKKVYLRSCLSFEIDLYV